MAITLSGVGSASGGHQQCFGRVWLLTPALTGMTTEMMNFRDLVEKAPDAELLREMIGYAAERLMKMEVGSATGGRTITLGQM